MSITYRNDDFVLKINDDSEKVLQIVNKYDAFLDAITTPEFEHVRESVRRAIHFFVSDKYTDTKTLAEENYQTNPKLQTRYKDVDEYLEQFRIMDRKSISIDLATGTGKSWKIYGVAQIMLAEGLVDKVLVLCPSLTIEEELKRKFNSFSGDANLSKILEECGAVIPRPAIKSANDPILSGDICVENIHAAYERTGSSIEDSFKGKGQRTLVISDEAHHIYSPSDKSTKKWFDFITNTDYDFKYLMGLSGTPYIGDDYFPDIIYRYGIRQAIEDRIIKTIDYKIEESFEDKGFDESYQLHQSLVKQYSGVLKPISIIITDKIFICIQVWNELVMYISKKEKISRTQAKKKVIWVTSGLPSKDNEKKIVKKILEKPDARRKENLALLKSVDEPDNPVQWIVSVSMLTEGWDVKNVFQIIPHEQRAFNSKLLISQVLGRGLRIPKGVEIPVYVKVNNHEKWTSNIRDLYNEVLEIENRLRWKYDENKKEYIFPLYNFDYVEQQDTTEVKKKPASAPESVKLSSQSKEIDAVSTYKLSGDFRFTVVNDNVLTIDESARQIKLFLKSWDEGISKNWTLKKIEEYIIRNLKSKGEETSYISRKNLAKIKQSFGPMFRETGTEVPRMKLKPNSLFEVLISDIYPQSFSERSIKQDGHLFYASSTENTLSPEEKEIFFSLRNEEEYIKAVKETAEKFGKQTDHLDNIEPCNLYLIDENQFKVPLNLLYVTFEPEYRFTKQLIQNAALFDAYLKSPDKGFYSIPYSYKPSDSGETHVKQCSFNPDFFLKVKDKNEILVVETKVDGDSSQKNKAKYRDALEHFKNINHSIGEDKLGWKYIFYFLSPEDYPFFFQKINEGKYIGWKSDLMMGLER